MRTLSQGEIQAHAQSLQTNEAFREWFHPLMMRMLSSVDRQIMDAGPKKCRGLRAQRELLIELTGKVQAVAQMKPQKDPPNEIPT